MDSDTEFREREALLERVREHVERHGIMTSTFEDLASALGVEAGRLREFFPTKTELAVALVARNRIRLREKFANLDQTMADDDFRREMWEFYVETADASRLFFEVYGLAIADAHYGEFLHGINDWLDLVTDAMVRRGVPAERADAFATLGIAVYRGAMMDWLATGDRARVNAAMELWFKAASWLSQT
ncbi:MAG TPA: hypothetical protein VMD47_11740 [Candidatus Acidoferrales bacterium]|nr:hypothetical protein [Candidatus Acidoferrales bacterium]